MSENVLEVKNLCKYFDVNRGMKGAHQPFGGYSEKRGHQLSLYRT